MAVDASRTYHANQAVELGELLAIRFGDLNFGNTTRRNLKVSEPDGPSTDGGRKARQSILLAPDGRGPAIVCGFLDVSRRTAEVRSFVLISQQYQQRHGVGLDFTREDYDRFVHELLEFLKLQGMDTRVSNAAQSSPAPRSSKLPKAPQAPRPQVHAPALIVAVTVGLVMGFALGYVVFGLGIL